MPPRAAVWGRVRACLIRFPSDRPIGAVADLHPSLVGRDQEPAPGVPFGPLHVLEVAREAARAQLVPHVRAGPVELADRRVRPPDGEAVRAARARARLLHHDAVTAPLVPRVVLGSRRSLGGLGPAPTAFDREGIGARQPQAEAFPHRAEVAEVRLVDLEHGGVLHELHPAGPRAADPPPGQSPEPWQPRDDDVRGAELPLGCRLQGEVGEPPAVRRQVAPLRVDRAAEPRAGLERRRLEIPSGDVHPIRRAPADDGDHGSSDRRDAEDARTHPAMVAAGDRGMVPMEPLSRSRLPSGARSSG